MKIKTLLSALLLTVATSTFVAINIANAQSRTDNHHRDTQLTVNLGGQLYGNRGGRENPTLFLRMAIKNQYPRIALKNYKLQSVKVVGVSRARQSSNSTLQLFIAGNYNDQAVLDHRGRGHNGLDNAELFPRRNHARGDKTWQIKFSAATQVNRVIVVLEKINQGGGGHPVHMQSKGVLKIQKFVVLPESVNVNQWVDRIQIKGFSRTVSVHSVEAVFQSGERRILNLGGVISQGQSLRTTLPRQMRLSYLIISATSTSLSGSRGEIEVLVGNSGRR